MRVVTNNQRGGDAPNFAKVLEVPDVNVSPNPNFNGGGCSEVRRVGITESSPATTTTTTSLFGSSIRDCGGVVVGLEEIGLSNGTGKKCSFANPGDYVTINNTNSSPSQHSHSQAKCNNTTGGSCSCSFAATPTKPHALVPENGSNAVEDGSGRGGGGVYNGIFLVDGLGQGVRIERQMSMMDAVTTGHYEYGLPEQSSIGNFGATRDRDRQYFPSVPLPLVHSHSPQNSGSEQSPVCIRIDAGTSTSPIIRNATTTNYDTSKFCVGVSCPPQNYFSGQSPSGPTGAIVPVVPGCSSNSTYVVPKGSTTNRNTVTLPVPSPPPHMPVSPGTTTKAYGEVPLPGLNPDGNATPTTTAPVTTNPKSHNTNGNLAEQRTLISTEAQTEDLGALTTLPPPPPPSRNREQRKRERRERRRADRSQNYHRSSSQGSSSRMPPLSGHRSSDPSGDNVIYANATTICAEQQQHQGQRSDQRNSQIFGETTLPPNCQGQGQLGLPDLLNSHLPPPYSTLPQSCERRVVLGNVPLHHHHHPLPPPGHHPHPQQPMQMQIQGFPGSGMMAGPPPMLGPIPPPQPVCMGPPPQPVRYHFAPTARASRRSLRTPRGVPYASEEEPKSCCGMSTSQAVSIRWFIIVIAVIGICCTVAGTALGAARSAGSQHLTLSLLMIGVGVVLLTVSAVAWRLTANESGTSCRAMLGFARSGSSRGDGGDVPNRRFVPRLAPSYGRPHHPFSAMMYPDFQYRPPPPSYQASMQEYRLRLLLLERSNPTIAAAAGMTNPISSSMIPPPAYRPYNGLRPGGLRNDMVDYARPPSYRSRSSGGYSCHESSPGSRPSMIPGLDHPHHHHHMMSSPLHSRDPSILSYLSQQSLGDNVSVVSGAGTNGHGNSTNAVVTVMQAVSVGMDLGMMSPMNYDPNATVRRDEAENADSKEMPEPNEDEGLVVVGGKKGGLHSEKSGRSKDGNLVRIVQTTDSSQVIGRNSESVIVSIVSGSNHSLWDQSLQNAVNNNANSTNANNHHSVGNPAVGENNEVQILAHL